MRVAIFLFFGHLFHGVSHLQRYRAKLQSYLVRVAGIDYKFARIAYEECYRVQGTFNRTYRGQFSICNSKVC